MKNYPNETVYPKADRMSYKGACLVIFRSYNLDIVSNIARKENGGNDKICY